MRILVTGGAGFIGSHLVDRLVLDQAGEVVVLDNFSRGRTGNLARSQHQVSLVRGDIRDRELLEKVMSGVNLVFHLAAQSNVLDGLSDPDGTFETNVAGTYEVLRAATSAGVTRVIFSSSREVYGEPLALPVMENSPLSPKNDYGASKAAAEMYCRLFSEAGMEVVILRLTNVYGCRDRARVIPLFIEQALSGKPLTVFGSDKILDFLWIEHLIDVLCRASQRSYPDLPVNVGSGKGIKVVDLAERIRALTGGGSCVLISEERRPEVGRFVADVTIACNLFDLQCPEDPLEHLPLLIKQSRSEMRTQTHGVTT